MSTLVESYDSNKIGKLISWGSDHTVYNYGDDRVIKFSLIEVLMGKNGSSKVDRDYSISKEYFGKFVLDTQFTISPNGKWRAAVQKKVIGRYLEEKDLEDSEVKNQFLQIMKGCDALAMRNAKIDLVGRGGILKSCMSNIFITPQKQLVIIDATLLECQGAGIFKLLFMFVFILANWRNKYTIRKFNMKIVLMQK